MQEDMLVPRVQTQKTLFLLKKDTNQGYRWGSTGEMNVRASNYNQYYLGLEEVWKKK